MTDIKQTPKARIINDVLYPGVRAEEAMRRLNAHDELVAALRLAETQVGNGITRQVIRAALAKLDA